MSNTVFLERIDSDIPFCLCTEEQGEFSVLVNSGYFLKSDALRDSIIR